MRGIRLLSVSDLHYALRQFDWLLGAADDFDVVVLAGDLLDIASSVAPDAQIAVVSEYIARLTRHAEVVVCSGNHDLDGHNELGERSARWLDAVAASGAHVDGSRVERADTLVTVCAWWDGPLTRAVVEEQLRSDAARVDGRRWIWAYHAPPAASPTSWTGSRHYGDEDLDRWIDAFTPDIVITGHVHPSPFLDDGAWVDRLGTTTVFNAGRQPGDVPARLELDTVENWARWVSYQGIDQVVLDPA
jgi:Icc-related predicted phosphoesterase